MTTKIRNSSTCIRSILLFIFAPFLSFIFSFVNLKNGRNLWIIFFFYLLFGLCFTLNQQSGFDSLRYVEKFQSIETGSLKEIFITNMIEGESISDIYFPIGMWIAHKLGDNNYHVLFLFFAFVFAIFTIQTLKIFYKYSRTSKWWMYSLLVLILIMNNFIFNINGMRFWTAAWIFIYGILAYYLEHKKLGLILLCLTPLVHSTFILTVLIFFLSNYFGKFEKAWIYCLIFSIPFSFLSLKLIPYAASVIPDMYMGKFEFYTEEHYVQARSSGIGFTHLEDFMRTCMMILEAYVLYKIYKTKKYDVSSSFRLLFQYTLVFITLSNFFSALPSMGRYIIVGVPLVIFFIWINSNNINYRQYLILFLATMSFAILNLLMNKVALVLPSNFYYSNAISLFLHYI